MATGTQKPKGGSKKRFTFQEKQDILNVYPSEVSQLMGAVTTVQH